MRSGSALTLLVFAALGAPAYSQITYLTAHRRVSAFASGTGCGDYQSDASEPESEFGRWGAGAFAYWECPDSSCHGSAESHQDSWFEPDTLFAEGSEISSSSDYHSQCGVDANTTSEYAVQFSTELPVTFRIHGHVVGDYTTAELHLRTPDQAYSFGPVSGGQEDFDTYGSAPPGTWSVDCTLSSWSGGVWYRRSGFLFTLTVFEHCDSPVITGQPHDAMVRTGDRADFNVTAAGDGLSYRWRRNGYIFSDDTRIVGGTTPNLVLKWTLPEDDGDVYDVLVTSECSQLASEPAALIFGCPPDCDRNGRLNINDYLCFQRGWAYREPYSDYDKDGRYTINDFIGFAADYSLSCP